MKTLLAIAAAAAAFGAAPAPARDSAPASAIQTVRYADLDLSTDSGRAALDRRLSAAIRQVCGDASDADLHGQNAVGRCRTQTARSLAAQREAALASAASPGRLASAR